MKSKLNQLCFLIPEWNCISLLVKVLEPFYDATIQLQTQKFPTLSIVKIIENSLFEFFESKAKQTNQNNQERWICEDILENLQKYLITNISSDQKNDNLVISFCLKFY